VDTVEEVDMVEVVEEVAVEVVEVASQEVDEVAADSEAAEEAVVGVEWADVWVMTQARRMSYVRLLFLPATMFELLDLGQTCSCSVRFCKMLQLGCYRTCAFLGMQATQTRML